MQLDVDERRVVEVEVPDEGVERVDGGNGLEHLVHLGEFQRGTTVHGDRETGASDRGCNPSRFPNWAILCFPAHTGEHAPLDPCRLDSRVPRAYLTSIRAHGTRAGEPMSRLVPGASGPWGLCESRR